MLAEVDQRVAAGTVTPSINLEEFQAELKGFDFQQPARA